MPSETSPLNLALLILTPPGNLPPTLTTITCWPSSTFGAPQTICTCSSSPTSTLQIFNLSASGCFSLETTSPTTNFLISFLYSVILSPSIPLLVIFSASSSIPASIFINSFNHSLLTNITLHHHLLQA